MDQVVKLNLEKAFRFHHFFGNSPVVIDEYLFYKPTRFIYQMVPSIGDKDVSCEVSKLLQKEKFIFGVRYFKQNSLMNNDLISMLVCTPPYDFSSIQSKARNQTRRGLERVVCEKINFNHFVEASLFDVYKDNAMRLNLFKSINALNERWRKWRKVLMEVDLLDVWVAKKNGMIVAFVVVAPFYVDGGEILLHRSLGSVLKDYPNNALLYSLLLHYFQKGWKFVSYGLSSWRGVDSGLLHFKQNMGFQNLYWSQYLKLTPYLSGAVISIKSLKKVYNFWRR